MFRRAALLSLITLGLLAGPAGAAAPVQGALHGLQITATLTKVQLSSLGEIELTAVIRNESTRAIGLRAPTPCTASHWVAIYAPDGSRAGAIPPESRGKCAQVISTETWQPGQETRYVFRWGDELPLGGAVPGVYTAEIRTFLMDPAEPGLVLRFRIGEFADTENHWSAPFARKAAQQDWLLGYPDNTFRPDRTVTLGELTKMLSAARGLPQTLVSEPERPVTRLEAVREMLRAAGIPTAQAGTVQFSDTADPVAATASATGLTNGYPDGTFRPDQVATRAEVVAMILRLPPSP